MFEKSDQRKNVSGYVEYVDTLKQLIRQHSTKSHGGRRRRKRWWDGEVQAAIQLRKEVNRQHRFALHAGSSHEIAEKWKMYQEQKNATKQLVQQKLAAADLDKIREIRSEPVEATTEKEWESVVRKRVREQENVQWLEAARTKSTLTMYAELKQQITAETRLYDNSLGSCLLFEARAGALRTLVYKQRFDNNVQSTVCRVCEEPKSRRWNPPATGDVESWLARTAGSAAASDEWGTMRRKGASFPYAIIAMATTAPAGPTRSSRPQEQNPGSSPLGPPLVPSLSAAAARCCTALGTRLYTKASLLSS
ncbi:hypothetical protein HPB47_025059 [Ixodes persulcatus]|uniref:Uncharacterized protein n=1 Tax=Ixodes persulcatus TaxID=34615 RepID=A0AC60Q2L1_IXOPE|nr:hypothetical protein HPB47_025059 [Ixodes persulcatus]